MPDLANPDGSWRNARRGLLAIWQSALILIWGLWWGGLCFYAAVVVPIGTRLIGGTEQGFITQQVTNWHNCILALFVLCLSVEAARLRRWSLGVLAAVLALIDIALFVQHASLTSMMDFSDRSVAAPFYDQHAVYLWLTTAEWTIGIFVGFLLSIHPGEREAAQPLKNANEHGCP